ncbi:hypothetical protein D3C85_1946590 [compost metagenome]
MAQTLFAGGLCIEDGAHLRLRHPIALQSALDLQLFRYVHHQDALGHLPQRRGLH